MKIFLTALTALFLFQSVFALDWIDLTGDKINDDYRETNMHAIHSTGLFTYGFHSNTFHLRNWFFRYNLSVQDVQFILTLNGNKDTHVPETNYTYILNNINLYDYGIRYVFLDHFFVSFRGASVYKLDQDSYLLVKPYYSSDNPAEFDTPVQYIPHLTGSMSAPGIRAGFTSDHFEIGYSQGDFRHAIPIAGVIKYYDENFYVRTTIQRVNKEPLTYFIENFFWVLQLSSAGHLRIGEFDLLGLGDITWSQLDGALWLRLEQGVEWNSWILAVRELYRFGQPFLFEASIKYNLFSVASIGLFAGTDGRIYLGSQVEF